MDSRIGTTPTILDLANSSADGDSPIDSTDSDAARKARLSDS